MPYVKLTSKLRRTLEEIQVNARQTGFRVDMRWLEKHGDMCALCGRTGGRAGMLSILEAAQANLAKIPYTTCEDCVRSRFDMRSGTFGPENLDRITERVLRALDIDPTANYMKRVPEKFMPFIEGIMEPLHEEGITLNPVWLQNHMNECPGCGGTMEKAEKAGITIAGIGSGPPIAFPYLLCENCSRYSDDQTGHLVIDRLAAAIGKPLKRPVH